MATHVSSSTPCLPFRFPLASFAARLPEQLLRSCSPVARPPVARRLEESAASARLRVARAIYASKLSALTTWSWHNLPRRVYWRSPIPLPRVLLVPRLPLVSLRRPAAARLAFIGSRLRHRYLLVDHQHVLEREFVVTLAFFRVRARKRLCDFVLRNRWMRNAFQRSHNFLSRQFVSPQGRPMMLDD